MTPEKAPLYRYVALGDSAAVGVGSASDGGYAERLFRRLRESGVPAGILNLGVSGATSSNLVQGPLAKAVQSKPALVTVCIGNNDLWRMVPAGTFALNLKMIADRLETTGAEVVVTNLVDLSLAPIAARVESFLSIPRSLFVKRVEQFNALFEPLRRRPRFTVVDLFSFSHRTVPGHPELFSADGFHPSSLGYDAWAEMMWPAVEAAARRWQQGQKSEGSRNDVG